MHVPSSSSTSHVTLHDRMEKKFKISLGKTLPQMLHLFIFVYTIVLWEILKISVFGFAFN